MSTNEMEIKPAQLIGIIGAKEVDICIMRGQISELTSENGRLKEKINSLEKAIPDVRPKKK